MPQCHPSTLCLLFQVLHLNSTFVYPLKVKNHLLIQPVINIKLKHLSYPKRKVHPNKTSSVKEKGILNSTQSSCQISSKVIKVLLHPPNHSFPQAFGYPICYSRNRSSSKVPNRPRFSPMNAPIQPPSRSPDHSTAANSIHTMPSPIILTTSSSTSTAKISVIRDALTSSQPSSHWTLPPCLILLPEHSQLIQQQDNHWVPETLLPTDHSEHP